MIVTSLNKSSQLQQKRERGYPNVQRKTKRGQNPWPDEGWYKIKIKKGKPNLNPVEVLSLNMNLSLKDNLMMTQGETIKEEMFEVAIV